MTAEQIVQLLGASGAGAIILALVNGVVKWLSGASAREREKNTDLISQRVNAIEARDEAEKERDEEARKRREAEEHVSMLKRQVLEFGAIPVERTNKKQMQE